MMHPKNRTPSFLFRVLPTRRAMQACALAVTCGLSVPLASSCASDEAAKAPRPDEYLQRLKRDIFKVDKSIEVTKKLIQRSKGERYLPDLYFRLAELLIEKARLVYFRVLEEAGADEKSAVVAPEAKLLKQQAVTVYKRILAEFPDWQDNDKVTFFIAHEYRELGQYDKMIRTYERLVRSYPKSKLRFEAWLILGNHHFDKDDIKSAARYYQKILKNPETYAHNMARYKYGWCLINEDKTKAAVDYWEAAVRTPTVPEDGDKPRRIGDDRGRLDVRREALKDLAFYYAEARKPKTALKFFQQLTESRDEYRVVLERLARRFNIKSLYKESAEVYRELLKTSKDLDRNIEWAQSLYESVVASKNLKRADNDVIALAEVSRRYRASFKATEEDKVVIQDFELLTRDLATRLHGLAKRNKNQSDYRRAARAYEAYLFTFYDSPERLAIEWNYADALYGAKDYVKAGKQYESIMALLGDDAPPPLPPGAEQPEGEEGEGKDGEGKDGEKAAGKAPADAPKKGKGKDAKAAVAKAETKKPDAKKASAKAVKRVVSTSGGPGGADIKEAMYGAVVSYFEALKKEDTGTRLDSMMAREGIKYIGARFVQTFPDDKNASQVKFNVARAYYEQGEFDGAIKLFTAFVNEHPTHKDAPAAAELALDAYAQDENFTGLADAARKFAKIERLADANFRKRFEKMASQAEQEEINRKTIQAEGKVKEALASFIVDKKGTEIAAKALHQAFVIARDRRNVADMLDAGRPLLEEYGDTKYAVEVLPSLAEAAVRTLQLEQAANFYEEYGRRYPRGENVDGLMEAAANIRLALGEYDAARAIYERLTRQGAPERQASYWSKLAKVSAQAGDYRAAEQAAINVLDDATFASQAGVIAGEAALRNGELELAAERFQEVIALGATGEWLARAHYGIGEVVRTQFEAIRIEPGNEGEAIGAKFEVLEVMSGAYVGVIQTGEPEWTMGALYRIAMAYRQTADFLDNAPLPQGMSAQEEKAFRAALKERSGPMRKEAADTLKACRDKSKSIGAYNRFVKACVTEKEVDEFGDVQKSRQAGLVIPGRAALEKKLADRPKDIESYVTFAQAALSVGDYHLARLVAQRGLELQRKNATLHNIAGVAAVGIGDLQGAAASFKTALKRSSRMGAARANLAGLIFMMGDTQRAVTEGNRVKEIDPANPTIPAWADVQKAGGGPK